MYETAKPTIFDLYRQAADIVGPLELEPFRARRTRLPAGRRHLGLCRSTGSCPRLYGCCAEPSSFSVMQPCALLGVREAISED